MNFLPRILLHQTGNQWGGGYAEVFSENLYIIIFTYQITKYCLVEAKGVWHLGSTGVVPSRCESNRRFVF